MQGDMGGAISWLQQALDVDPSFSMALAYLAMAYSVKGDEAKARATIARLRQLPPEYRLTPAFERPSPSYPAAYQEWYRTKFLPVARKVGVLE